MTGWLAEMGKKLKLHSPEKGDYRKKAHRTHRHCLSILAGLVSNIWVRNERLSFVCPCFDLPVTVEIWRRLMPREREDAISEKKKRVEDKIVLFLNLKKNGNGS